MTLRSDLVSGNVCLTTEQGHFSVVVESSAPPVCQCPLHHLKVVTLVERTIILMCGEFLGQYVVVLHCWLLIVWAWRYRRRKRMSELERAADAGEALRMTIVGSMTTPFAMATRTMPNLETDFSL
ncbi:uncharacterized protein [Rutidosis leptorrhynchoides]|uniref:uncharacterized protein n=1 Tax=Rutidosis leptorrhynchoides TaxID=125765 RepID=UPI003A998A7F